MNVLLPLAVVAIAGTATIASAENSFGPATLQATTSSVHFDVVNSDAVGVVEIYDYRSHVVGKLLGSQAVALGGNPELQIPLSPYPSQSVIAVLVIGDVEMTNREVHFHLRGR